MRQFEAEARRLAEQYDWSAVELSHALGSLDAKYKNEAVVELASGRKLHCPAYPADCDYVRIVQDGFELAYWCSDEWEESPMDVMGAIVGAMMPPIHVRFWKQKAEKASARNSKYIKRGY
jgi:hypothetical protein